jgi:RimJ/RimL family protein N-acetyltransferase
MVSNNPSTIEIRKLLMTDLQDLITLWNKDPKDYNKHFIPFEINYENLASILQKTDKDLFFGIFVDKKIAGFFMLRGFDDGYDIPSYGVWISSKFANKGLAKLTLQYSLSICRLAGVKRIMLKFHPENIIAMKMYKYFGFEETGIDEKIGHIIMHMDLV